jgi:hypothetical protein
MGKVGLCKIEKNGRFHHQVSEMEDGRSSSVVGRP